MFVLRFHVLTVTYLRIAFFWDVAAFSLIDVDQMFQGNLLPLSSGHGRIRLNGGAGWTRQSIGQTGRRGGRSRVRVGKARKPRGEVGASTLPGATSQKTDIFSIYIKFWMIERKWKNI
jgi:hypothetical protein